MDPSKIISKISFGISICDSIIAIRCYDENHQLFVDTNWWDQRGHDPNIENCLDGNYSADLKEWQTKYLTPGNYIIGLKMHFTTYGDIMRIGLVTHNHKPKMLT